MSCNTTLTSVTSITPFTAQLTQSNGADKFISGWHIIAGGVDYYIEPVSVTIKDDKLYLCDRCCNYMMTISTSPYTKEQLGAMFTAMWTTATRPTAPVVGQQGYNTDMNVYEYWNGTIWIQY